MSMKLLKNKTLGIVGCGVVGKAIVKSYVEHVKEILIYDIDPLKTTCSMYTMLAGSCDLIMICLPTPSSSTGVLSTSAIRKMFEDMTPNQRKINKFVIRSTIPVGFTDQLASEFDVDICHSPEFLTARCAAIDAMMPTANFIGRNKFDTGRDSASTRLWDLYSNRFPETPCIVLDSKTTEFMKIMKNSFFAAKIGLFNEFKTIALSCGVDWNSALNGMLKDGRIHPSHTQVPGQDSKTGFGGSCLPKDILELKTTAEISKVRSPILDAVIQRNNTIDRPTNHDLPGKDQ